MSPGDLTAEEADALRRSVRSSVERFGDAERVAKDIGAEDLLTDARPALALFFEEFGRLGLVNSLADLVVREALGFDLSGGPSFGYPIPHRGSTEVSAVTSSEGGVAVDALLRLPGGEPPQHVVLGVAPEGAVTVPVAELDCSPATGFDASGGWLRIRGEISGDGLTAVSFQAWPHAVAMVRLALGSEILGVAAKINTVAIEHVSSRHQFGKPLGSFQSVRHRLAEAHTAINAAQHVLAMGWNHSVSPAQTGDRRAAEDLGVYAIAAKSLAGRAFEVAGRHATQVCGAMGLTWEHPLPALIRRGSALNVLLGSPVDLAAHLGKAMAAGTSLPQPDPLVVETVQDVAP